MLSGVILAYTLNDHLKEITLRCIKSFKNQLDELIIIEDGGNFIKEYLLADTYIYNSFNRGFTKSVNLGLKISRGTHTAIISSDTYLVDGNLKDLKRDTVVSPKIRNQMHIEGMCGSFFVVPKKITKEYGYLDESMKTYGSDEEYKRRVPNIRIDSTIIHHDIAQTVKCVDQSQK